MTAATDAVLIGFLAATVRVTTPLLLAATGELVAERAGVLNLGIEGTMLSGALAAALGAVWGGPWAGLCAAVLTGTLLGLLFAALAVGAGVDQVIAGTALTLGSIGATGAVYHRAFGASGAGLSIPTFTAIAVPELGGASAVRAVLEQPAPTYLAILLVIAVWWLLRRTRAGLWLRASGEGAAAAEAMGIPVRWVRAYATMFAGALAGVAGATLVLAQVGTFTERMTAGRGFVAIAIVVLGRWQPGGVLIAALLFGAATALQYVFQASGLNVPYQVFLMLPYALTLGALALTGRQAAGPADLGRTLAPGIQ